MSLHQVYATHCTWGTSAQKRRKGEGADEALGYGPRASSLSGERLDRVFRDIERYLHYGLPDDVDVCDYRTFPVHEAPRRLVFEPGRDGFAIAGCIGYRQEDTRGRAGCYFAHFLIDESATMTALDVLRLWDAPGWCLEDHAGIPFDLPVLESANELRKDTAPSICDDLLVAFVRSRLHSAAAIPERWRDLTASQLRTTFACFLQSVLEMEHSTNSCVLVAEPSVAALLMYGVFRLLPVDLVGRWSFSTYEREISKARSKLIATTRYTPENNAPIQGITAQHILIDPFEKRLPTVHSRLVPYILDVLSKDGVEAVIECLGAMRRSGCTRLVDMEGFIDARRASVTLLRGVAPDLLGPPHLLTREIESRLPELTSSGIEGAGELLSSGNPRALVTVVETVAGSDKCAPALRVLFQHINANQFLALMRSSVEDLVKQTILSSYLRKNQYVLPDEYTDVWRARSTPAVWMLGNLRTDEMASLLAGCWKQERPALLRYAIAIATACEPRLLLEHAEKVVVLLEADATLATCDSVITSIPELLARLYKQDGCRSLSAVASLEEHLARLPIDELLQWNTKLSRRYTSDSPVDKKIGQHVRTLRSIEDLVRSPNLIAWVETAPDSDLARQLVHNTCKKQVHQINEAAKNGQSAGVDWWQREVVRRVERIKQLHGLLEEWDRQIIEAWEHVIESTRVAITEPERSLVEHIRGRSADSKYAIPTASKRALDLWDSGLRSIAAAAFIGQPPSAKQRWLAANLASRALQGSTFSITRKHLMWTGATLGILIAAIGLVVSGTSIYTLLWPNVIAFDFPEGHLVSTAGTPELQPIELEEDETWRFPWQLVVNSEKITTEDKRAQLEAKVTLDVNEGRIAISEAERKQITGQISNINKQLERTTYRPADDTTGSATLTVSLESSGNATVRERSFSVQFKIAPKDDPSTLVVELKGRDIDDDNPLRFSNTNLFEGVTASFADPDVADLSTHSVAFKATVPSSSGTLQFDGRDAIPDQCIASQLQSTLSKLQLLPSPGCDTAIVTLSIDGHAVALPVWVDSPRLAPLIGAKNPVHRVLDGQVEDVLIRLGTFFDLDSLPEQTLVRLHATSSGDVNGLAVHIQDKGNDKVFRLSERQKDGVTIHHGGEGWDNILLQGLIAQQATITIQIQLEDIRGTKSKSLPIEITLSPFYVASHDGGKSYAQYADVKHPTVYRELVSFPKEYPKGFQLLIPEEAADRELSPVLKAKPNDDDGSISIQLGAHDIGRIMRLGSQDRADSLSIELGQGIFVQRADEARPRFGRLIDLWSIIANEGSSELQTVTPEGSLKLRTITPDDVIDRPIVNGAINLAEQWFAWLEDAYVPFEKLNDELKQAGHTTITLGTNDLSMADAIRVSRSLLAGSDFFVGDGNGNSRVQKVPTGSKWMSVLPLVWQRTKDNEADLLVVPHLCLIDSSPERGSGVMATIRQLEADGKANEPECCAAKLYMVQWLQLQQLESGGLEFPYDDDASPAKWREWIETRFDSVRKNPTIIKLPEDTKENVDSLWGDIPEGTDLTIWREKKTHRMIVRTLFARLISQPDKPDKADIPESSEKKKASTSPPFRERGPPRARSRQDSR